MKAKIEIECETGKELVQHLQVLTKQIKDKIKAIKASTSGTLKKPLKFEDDNCYGSHTATVRDFSLDDLTDDGTRDTRSGASHYCNAVRDNTIQTPGKW